jgi:hypothetical protein
MPSRRRSARVPLTAAALLLAPLAPAAATAQAAPAAARYTLPKDSMELARKYTKWLYEAQFDSIKAHHPESQRNDPNLLPGLAARLEQIVARAGTEVEVVEEKFVWRNGRRQYWRTAKFTNLSEPLLLRWVMGPKGEIEGHGASPLSMAPPIDPPA